MPYNSKVDTITVLFETGFTLFLFSIQPMMGVVIGGILAFAHVCPEFAHDHEGER